MESEKWDEAILLAREAEEFIPNDSGLIRLWPRFSDFVKVNTEPPGATVFRKPYGDVKSGWTEIGVPPIVELRSPFAWVNFRVEKESYRTQEWGPID